MNILDDLYFGNINPNCKMAPPGSKLRKIQTLVMQNEKKLCATLSNEQKELFEKGSMSIVGVEQERKI